ncbi:MAG: hypothetical protein ABIF71_06350 [Planctomycetota bacterium]
MKRCLAACALTVVAAAWVCGASAGITTYVILKEADVPAYDEWRMNLNVDTFSWENFGWGVTATAGSETSWNESLYSVSMEWGFWTFALGDISLGAKLPYYFWYAKDGLKDFNNGLPGAKTKNVGWMDPELFGDFKFKLTDHVSGLAHLGMTVPALSLGENAVDGGAALGVTRLTLMGGVLVQYNRFIAKIMVGAETGGTPDVETKYDTPALIVPQVAGWDNSNVILMDIETIFCASATTGFGLEYMYKGAYFKGGSWDTDLAVDSEPDPLGMLVINMYFADTSSGFYSAESGTIFAFGIGMGGIGSDPDLNPDILYRVSVSKYF